MYSTERIYIRGLELKDAHPLYSLRVRDREFLLPFEPVQPDSHFTLKGQKEIIQKVILNRKKDAEYGFGIFLTKTDRLIGRVNLSNIVHGAWQNCTIGYFLDQELQGQGYMTEAVKLAVRFAFDEAHLHRVQAAIMPRNIASARVVEKAGFRYEGLSKHYLKINGVWEDHRIYAITKEDFTSFTYL